MYWTKSGWPWFCEIVNELSAELYVNPVTYVSTETNELKSALYTPPSFLVKSIDVVPELYVAPVV